MNGRTERTVSSIKPGSKVRPTQPEPSEARSTLVVTDIPLQCLNGVFGIKEDDSPHHPHWDLQPSQQRDVPEYLDDMFEEYDLELQGAEWHTALARAKIDAIVLTTLASKKREEFSLSGQERSPGKRVLTKTTKPYESIYVDTETEISLPWKLDGEMRTIQGCMDYSVFYGKSEELEMNMVLIAQRLARAGAGLHQAKVYMSMLHNAGKRASRAPIDMYGAPTDGETWYFLRLNPENELTTKYYRWTGVDKVNIVSHLHRILENAATT
ncbi:hypothetical protein BDW74DRAFT_175936 [Aspergillus multicolor]|uniref:uncharacterized protein n=1 Tax=Aspergillus multicolor TaxID=41759 RepID=UPI003CCE3781